MPFTRTLPELGCPNRLHRHSRVCGNGTYTSGERTYRRYRCRPRNGACHTFGVLLDDAGEPRPTARSQPPPTCTDHPAARHVRDGHYGARSGRPRQRYRCYGNGKPRGHAYTPPLPRTYLGHDALGLCKLCEEPLSVHRGEPANARRHTWLNHLVAEGLIFLSRAETYGEVGRWAYRVGPPRVRRASKPRSPKPAATAESNARWHIAADWVECYSAVIWEPLEARMKASALAERRRIDAELAAGKPRSRPIIWVADELTIHGKTKELFSVLVVGEAEWREGSDEPHLRLRVARAMPDRTVAAWMLVFDELARVPGETDEIWPDFLVADGGLAIKEAARLRFGDRTRWVPSTWHIGYRIRWAYLGGKTPPRERLADHDLERHLDLLGRASEALASVAGWRAWWDKLATLMPGNRSIAGQRATYESAYAAVIPELGASRIPISNAGLEELIKARVSPLFHKRTSFTSIERTNRLTDLAICAARYELDEVTEVARRLRADANANGGRTTALRAVSDPADPERGRRYVSLRDRSLTSRIAYERELR